MKLICLMPRFSGFSKVMFYLNLKSWFRELMFFIHFSQWIEAKSIAIFTFNYRLQRNTMTISWTSSWIKFRLLYHASIMFLNYRSLLILCSNYVICQDKYINHIQLNEKLNVIIITNPSICFTGFVCNRYLRIRSIEECLAELQINLDHCMGTPFHCL